MAGLMDKIKNTAQLAKLKGELLLLDRDISRRHYEFGIHLYDVLSSETNFRCSNSNIQEPFEHARHDIAKLMADKTQKQHSIELLTCQADRGVPAHSIQTKLQKAGQMAVDGGHEAKLMGEILLVDRKIKQRKEAFGVDVCVLLGVLQSNKAMPTADQQKVKSGLFGSMIKLSKKEQEIQQLVERVKKDTEVLEARKRTKEREIQERSNGNW
jgi:hypothetical protein